MFEKILLVDDDEASAFLSTIILSDMQAANDIVVARDGYSASDLLGEGISPDIIFLDINMPRMDGFEFLERIEKNGTVKKAKIIMLSACSRKEDKEKAFSFKCVLDYVEKPLTEDKVRNITTAYHRSVLASA